MSRFSPSVLALALLGTTPAAAQADPVALYGNDIVFEVWRKGSRVGEHRVSFAQEGGDLRVTSRMKIGIDVLFFTAYRFDYESVETWSGGALSALDVHVNDDGKKTHITAQRDGDGLLVRGPKGEVRAPATIIPTTHWNDDQPAAAAALDTLEGVVRPGPAEALGEETIKTASGTVTAQRFAYTGELKGTEVWYAQGRWVQMRFKGRDGSIIEYRCVRCGVATDAKA